MKYKIRDLVWVNNINNQQLVTMERLKQVTANENVEKLALKRLQHEMTEITHYVNELSKTVGQMQGTLPAALVLMSKLGSQLAITRSVLFEVTTNWDNEKIDPQLLHIFNKSLPCNKNCPLEQAKPVSCLLDQDQNLIIMRFDLRVTQPKVHVLAAAAFSTVYINLSSSELCYKEYFGPILVIYDEQLDCIVPIKSSTVDFANDVILKPDETYCNRKQVAPNNKFWQTSRCEPLNHIFEDDIVSVKHSDNENLIYCNTFKMKLYNKVEAIDCFHYRQICLQIGRRKYKFQQIRIRNEITFSLELSHRINF